MEFQKMHWKWIAQWRGLLTHSTMLGQKRNGKQAKKEFLKVQSGNTLRSKYQSLKSIVKGLDSVALAMSTPNDALSSTESILVFMQEIQNFWGKNQIVKIFTQQITKSTSSNLILMLTKRSSKPGWRNVFHISRSYNSTITIGDLRSSFSKESSKITLRIWSSRMQIIWTLRSVVEGK